jgi:hypothetical protein
LLVAGLHQAREEVVAGVLALAPDEVDEELLQVPHLRGRRGPRPEAGGAAPELDAVPGCDAEQFADHGDGQRNGELLEEVEPVAGELVEQRVGDLFDPRPQSFDGPGGERLVDELPQPGVVGRIGVEHVRARGRRDPRPPGVGPGFPQPRIGERGPRLGVAGDDPADLPVGKTDAVHAAVFAPPAVVPVRVGEESAVEFEHGQLVIR